VLAEGLWAELRGSGVDVLACVVRAVATPGLDAAMGRPAPGTLLPERFAEAALRRHPKHQLVKEPAYTHGDDDGAPFCGNQGRLRCRRRRRRAKTG
jgi:short-subunit dehydrogenase